MHSLKTPERQRDSLLAQSVKNMPINAGDSGLSPWWGRSPRKGNGNLFQQSCLGNPMDRGVWWATVHGVAKESDLANKQQHTSVSIVIHQQIKIYVAFYNFYKLSKSVAQYSYFILLFKAILNLNC